MRVLYIDGVGPLGGGSRSLFEAINAMPASTVEPYFVIQSGTVIEFYGQVAVDLIAARGLTRFDNTKYSHYRGVRWLVLAREVSYLPFTIMAMVRAKTRWRAVDVIHAAEITEILPGLLARWLFKAPLVVHVRSLQRVDEASFRCRWLTRKLRSAQALIAIDENVRSTLPPDVKVDVVHNAYTPTHAPAPDPTIESRFGAMRPSSLKIGFIGNLHVSKGIFDLLEAAVLTKKANRDVEFIIVGGVTMEDKGIKAWILAKAGLAQNVGTELADRVRALGLEDSFHLLGHTADIQRVYEKIDVLCFPSHFDAPGRPVFEAAFSAVPSIVAVNAPRPDTLVHGETGLAIRQRDPSSLAEAITYFADRRGEVARMGKNARELAERNHDPKTNARQLLEVYSRIVRPFSPRATNA